MIELQDISFRYAGCDDTESVSHINLSVKAGECLLLTGQSGCGKTTLTRILNGLCPQFYGGKLEGSYTLDGQDIRTLSLSSIGKLVGSVFQDPRSQFFCADTTDEVVFSMEARAFTRQDMLKRLEALWEVLPIQELMGQRIFNLSSGEKQKIAIASAYICGPKVLVLDEPSANLDAAATEQLAALLLRLKQQGHTLVISEHRLHYIARLFDRMIVMEHGRITKEYTQAEAQKLSREDLYAQGLRQLTLPILHTSSTPAFRGIAAIEAEALYSRKGNRQILEDLNLQIQPGEILAVTGGNGAGKTTLCQTLTGASRENSGIIRYEGLLTKPKERIRQSFLVGQDADYQLYAATVTEEVMLGLPPASQLQAQAEDCLAKWQLLPYQNRHPVSLSGGQKQRVLLAAATMRRTKVLVLDEPTSGLDGHHMRQTAALLRQLAEQGQSILLITHDTELIELCVDRIIHLRNRTIDYICGHKKM
ncbi:MAG: ABC transporter ATP-binding protein [Lachnospiraceae bacterium]